MNKEEFNLSERRIGINGIAHYSEEDVKEFIRLIEEKVLTNWKGQNEFIDWLRNKTGEKLI